MSIGQPWDAELTDQPEKRGSRDLEGGRGPAAVSAIRGEGLEDQSALERAHGFMHRDFTGTHPVHSRD